MMMAGFKFFAHGIHPHKPLFISFTSSQTKQWHSDNATPHWQSPAIKRNRHIVLNHLLLPASGVDNQPVAHQARISAIEARKSAVCCSIKGCIFFTYGWLPGSASGGGGEPAGNGAGQGDCGSGSCRLARTLTAPLRPSAKLPPP